jgi:ABC-type uncharacterized transport system ATPase component
MINENALRDVLLALAEQQKTHYVMVSSVLNEVDALRETVRALDPTFADVLEQKRLEAAQKQAATVTIVIHQFDEILRRLKAGEVC